MEPQTLSNLDSGDTLMLAREIVEQSSVTQVYTKVDDSTVKHSKSDETVDVAPDELVFRFELENAAAT